MADRMADTCPDCGRRITESHKAFTEQWERAGSEELCFPHVNFGGTELCVERTSELLRARITKLESEASAMLYVIQLADELRGWQTTAPATLVAEYDAARAAMRRAKP